MKNHKDKTSKNSTISGGDHFSLGLIAFGGLGMEVLYAYLLEPVLYGASMENWSTTQMIIHWVLTCITWGIFVFALIRKAEGSYQFPILKKGDPMRLWQWGLCLVLVFLAFLADYISWGGFKVHLELERNGILLFLFQYIYYAFETMLFLLIIVFGQKACEVWFRRPDIPYGGIICGLTWGLAHVFTKDLGTGLLGLILGFAMGGGYLLVNRDLKKAYGLLFLMFVL